MSTILQDIYDKNVYSKSRTWDNEEYRQHREEVVRNEQLLRRSLSKENLSQLIDLLDAIDIADTLWAEYCFLEGARTGARMVLELLYDKYEEFEWDYENL